MSTRTTDFDYLVNLLNTWCLIKCTNTYDLIENLLKLNNSIINMKNERGQTALMIACIKYEESIDIIKLFLENGAGVNDLDFDNNNALMIMFDRIKVIDDSLIKLFVEYDIDLDTINKNNETALMLVVKSPIQTNKLKIIKLLLDNCPNINYQDIHRQSALMFAREPDVVELLIKYGANVNQKSRFGTTLLKKICMNASSNTDLKIINLLLDNGANAELIFYGGFTALIDFCFNHRISHLDNIVNTTMNLIHKSKNVIFQKSKSCGTAYDAYISRGNTFLNSDQLEYLSGNKIHNMIKLADKC